MSDEKSKYPIGDMGEDFQPDAMEDFDRRVNSGEFEKLTIEEIRAVYVEEEIQRVNRNEEFDTYRAIEEMEEDEAGLND